jgi:hypothetical protein
MNTLGAAKFKQECLAILDRLGPVPIQTESAVLIGSLAFGLIRRTAERPRGLEREMPAHSCRAGEPRERAWRRIGASAGR